VNAFALCLDRVGKDIAPERGVLGPLGISVSQLAQAPSSAENQLKKADALLVNVTSVDAALLDRSPQCRVVVTYGVGYDHIDLDEARRRRVVVANVPDYCTDEVADHTMAMLLALARELVAGHELVRGGGWGVNKLGDVRRIRGRTLGLVGYGRTGRAVALRARGFGLRVIAHDPQVSWGGEGVTMLPSLAEVLQQADFVSLHAPLQKQTAHLIDDRAFALMKQGSILINTSRGGLVETGALLRALDRGTLAGAGLDVFSEEPPPATLLDHPHLLLSPHSAYYSAEAIVELKQSAAQAVAVALTGGTPTHRLA
jgi:D-3-phosphoglycerate dehydrogenase / 2-oxoglutarate reductase